MIALCVGVSGCFNKDTESTEKLTTIRIGVLPDESKEGLRRRLDPLVEYIAKETGIPCELIIPESYDDFLENFRTKNIDLAYFGGFTFVKAHILNGALPLVMRDTDVRFTSYFLVKSSNPAKGVLEFKGKKLGFGSKLSTSGHLMPRYFLEKLGIRPEQFFSSTLYSGAHDKTAYWVRDGQVDIGAVNSGIVDKMFSDGRLKAEQVRILWETPPYSDYVWALRSGVNKKLRYKIREAFLKLSLDNADHARILAIAGASYFLPASPDDFTELESIIKEKNLLNK